MTRTISPEGLAGIKRFEGCRLEAYRDAVGIWTIGYGHTRTAMKGIRITQERAEELLREDLRVFEKGVARLVNVPITQSQFDALVSFCYNCGLAAFEKSTLRRYINSRQNTGLIKVQFMRWDKAGGKPLAGLTKRRAWEALMWGKCQ